jgi:probable HAF family extracellular repeat protein
MTTIRASGIRSFVQAAIVSMALGFLLPAYAGTIGTRAYLVDLNNNEISALGTLGGANTSPSAINEAGQVAGGSQTQPYFENHAFVTGPDGTGITDLGTGGAYGINDAGQVVGVSETFNQAHNAVISSHAFVTGPNGVGLTDLGTFGGRASIATGINNSSQVVGDLFTDAEEQHAFITGPNGVGMTDLGTLGGRLSYVTGVNDAGQVVGVSQAAGGEFHAFIADGNGGGMTDLGTFGGSSSSVGGINSAGQVVGSFTTLSGETHAFITGPDGVGMTDLGAFGGISVSVFGVNDAGQVVGTFVTSSHEEHAFVTGPDGVGMTDLNLLLPHPQPVFLWTQAVDINNHGQVIVAASIVPEPETYALLLAGLVPIGIMAQRKLSDDIPTAAV